MRYEPGMLFANNYIVKQTVLFFILLLFLARPCFAGDGVVAHVGKTAIKEQELQAAIDIFVPKGGFHVTVSKEKRDEFRKSALEWLIEKELLYREAIRRGLTISKEHIDEVIAYNEEQLGSRAAFLKVLKAEGKTLKQFKKEIEREALINMLARTEIDEKSGYSEDEIKAYYVQNIGKFKRPESRRLWHILISVSPESSDKDRSEKKIFAQEVLTKIKGGEEFSAAAEKYSEDAYRVKGGDMGYIHKGRLTSEVEEAAFKLTEGELSGVIESIYGFHIIKAGDTKESETIGFEEIKAKLRSELESKRYQEMRNNYLNSLKEKTAVKIYKP